MTSYQGTSSFFSTFSFGEAPPLISASSRQCSVAALSSEDDGWSMSVQSEVRGIDGYPVVLPCTFNHPQHSQHSSLQVLWRRGHGQSAVVIYRCTSRPADPSCEPDLDQDQRYRLEGNPREHDLSLRINSATLQDNGRYYCRVEVLGREHITSISEVLTPVSSAPPRILALLVEGSELLGYTALCHVQGSPLPDVQWFGPDNQLEASPMGQGAPARYRSVSELRDVEPGQQYVCSASNPLGKEQATLFVLPPQPPLSVGGAPPHILLLLSVDLGAKLLLLVLMGRLEVQTLSGSNSQLTASEPALCSRGRWQPCSSPCPARQSPRSFSGSSRRTARRPPCPETPCPSASH
uniref:Ig-like domain-containing protein n=1 Tax=Oryzias melastigma TaxID=30732 RepID=A0A3B3D5R0_ORYME